MPGRSRQERPKLSYGLLPESCSSLPASISSQPFRLCLKTPSSVRERAFFRPAKTAKQAILALSSMQPDAAGRKMSRSKPDRVFRQSLDLAAKGLPLTSCGDCFSHIVSECQRTYTRCSPVVIKFTLLSLTPFKQAILFATFSISLTLPLRIITSRQLWWSRCT